MTRLHARPALGAVLVLRFFVTFANAQQQPVPLSVKKISDTVYWTEGGDQARGASSRGFRRLRLIRTLVDHLIDNAEDT